MIGIRKARLRRAVAHAPTLPAAPLAAAALVAVLASGCGKPQPPEKERPPEPQATRHAPSGTTGQPIERAKAAESEMQRAADAQREAIDAATGG